MLPGRRRELTAVLNPRTAAGEGGRREVEKLDLLPWGGLLSVVKRVRPTGHAAAAVDATPGTRSRLRSRPMTRAWITARRSYITQRGDAARLNQHTDPEKQGWLKCAQFCSVRVY